MTDVRVSGNIAVDLSAFKGKSPSSGKFRRPPLMDAI
jgi:hypothetical protein